MFITEKGIFTYRKMIHWTLCSNKSKTSLQSIELKYEFIFSHPNSSRKAMENLATNLKDSDAEVSVPDDLNNDFDVKQQVKRDFVYPSLINRRKPELSAEDNDRSLVLTPEDILTAQKLRLLDMLVQ